MQISLCVFFFPSDHCISSSKKTRQESTKKIRQAEEARRAAEAAQKAKAEEARMKALTHACIRIIQHSSIFFSRQDFFFRVAGGGGEEEGKGGGGAEGMQMLRIMLQSPMHSSDNRT